MKEGAKRHPPMFYTFDFFTLLDPDRKSVV